MEEFDVVIIGSGYGGSIPAARLAASGASVLVLERGPRLATSDLAQSDDLKSLTKSIDVVVTNSNLAYRTGTMVGGASIPMDGAHFRMPQKSFAAAEQDARRIWPEVYTREFLDPYYALAEDMLGIRQFGWDEIPRAGGLFAKMLDASGASCDRARMNYTDCLHCGYCSQGCTFDKKITLLHSYIPLAELNGSEFRAGARVDHIETDTGTGYIVCYELDGEERTVRGQRVIVGCGGVHTPALMLRSAPYLPNLSPRVGDTFNNNGEHAFIGILPPEFDDLDRYQCFKGMENAGLMSFHWWESDGITLHPGGGLEPSVFAAAIARADDAVLPARSWGLDYKRFVEAVYPHRVIAFSVLGLAPAYQAITIDDDGSPDTFSRDRSAHDAYLDRVEAIAADIEAATGVTLVTTVPRQFAGTTSAHLLSACRMATSAEHGVVDQDCQVFGYENLYICDASAVPSALGVNPALTISAIAERAAEQMIAKG